MLNQHRINLDLLKDNPWRYSLYVVVALSFVIASFKLFTPYSYWLDELYSVTTSSGQWSSIHTNLLQDVHPPLYQSILKIWIDIFGSHESVTRGMSWLCAGATICILFNFSKKYPAIFCIVTTIFFCTNRLVLFYANEARSYALTLLLATLVTTAYFRINKLTPDSKNLYLFLTFCLLLSLAHYFGLLLALTFLFVYAFEHRRARIDLARALCAAGLILIWPIYHFSNGAIGQKTSGNFWIKVDGLLDSINIATSALSTYSQYFGAVLVCWLFASFFLTRHYSERHPQSDVETLSLINKSAIVLILFLFSCASVDLVSPISTRRNYIVIVPLCSILVGGWLQIVISWLPKYRNILMSCLVIFALCSCGLSLRALIDKASATDQNWKSASQFMLDQGINKDRLYFLTDRIDAKWLISNYYLRRLSGNRITAKPFVIGEDKIKDEPALLLYGNLPIQTLRSEMLRLGAIQVFPNNFESITGVLMIK